MCKEGKRMSKEPQKSNFELAQEEANKIDLQIIDTLQKGYNFRVEAGAGSGKTYSLNKVIEWIQVNKWKQYRKKNQHVVDIKEIRLSLNIDTHDFETKAGHATRFLKEGDKVKVSSRFRGREMGHPEQGYEIMKRFAETLSEIANVEKPAKLEGRNMLMFLASKPAK